MSDHPFAANASASRGARPLLLLGAVLLVVALGSLGAMATMLAKAGANAEPGQPGLIPGQSEVFGPVAALLAIGILGLLAGVFSLMIGAKRLSRSRSGRA